MENAQALAPVQNAAQAQAARERRMEIANIILQQLGGPARLKMMCGAKDFIAVENGVQFRIGRNAKNVNKVRIVLNGSDLYDVEFGNLRVGKNVVYKIIDSSNDVYAEDLVRVFEAASGLYLSF